MKSFVDWLEWQDEEDFESEYNPPLVSAEIKSWLENSVVQNPVFHGTDKKFDQFKFTASKRYVLFSTFDVTSHGFFFTEDYKVAKKHGNNIVTAYVKMTNPLLDPRRDKHLGVDRLNVKKEAQIAFILRHMIKRHPEYGQYGEVGTSTFPVYARGKGNLKNVQGNLPSYHFSYDWIYNLIGSGGLHFDTLDNPQVVSSMKKLGYDGTFVDESTSSNGAGIAHPLGRSIFVQDASQIKIVEWTK